MKNEPTGMDLLATLHRGPVAGCPHDHCPECGDSISRVAITKLAYTFELCDCGHVDHDHLAEVIHHRTCLQPTRCVTFRPFRMRKPPRRPRPEPPDVCADCGRSAVGHDFEWVA